MHLLSQKKLTITTYFPYSSAFLPLIVISYSHKEAVLQDGGGTRGDRLKVGSKAQWDHFEDPVSPQGLGDGGAQGLDRWPPQGERRSADPGGGPGPEGEGGEGVSNSNSGGEDPGKSRAREVAHRLPEVL